MVTCYKLLSGLSFSLSLYLCVDVQLCVLSCATEPFMLHQGDVYSSFSHVNVLFSRHSFLDGTGRAVCSRLQFALLCQTASIIRQLLEPPEASTLSRPFFVEPWQGGCSARQSRFGALCGSPRDLLCGSSLNGHACNCVRGSDSVVFVLLLLPPRV